jgi:hypothetical protein
MFWERFTIRQMKQVFDRPRHEGAAGHSHPARTSGDRFGSCPNCRAFVRIGPVVDPPGEESCPECHRPIRELDSLGAGEDAPG